MSVPAGLPPPRPDQAYTPGGAPMAPGSQTPVVRARQVIVFGPSGQVVGIFVYAVGTTPGAGNPPVDSITRSATDPFGNAVQEDFVAYGSGGAYVQMTDGQINFQGASGQESPAQILTDDFAGLLQLTSGLVNGTDVDAEIVMLSQDAGAGTSSITLTATQVLVNTGNLNGIFGMGIPPNYPTTGKTLAQTQAALDNLIGEMQNRGLIS